MASILKHKTLSGALLEEIRQAILSGRYPAGSQLRQDALAEEYGVSRIPIREVLLQLDAEGLVVVQARKGAVVSRLSSEEIEDVFALRILLEERLYRASAPLLGEDDLAAIAAIQARYVAAIGARDIARFGEMNAVLHRAFYARAPQPRTILIVGGLLATSERYTRMQLSTPQAMARAIHEHDELIELTRRRDFDAGARRLVAHIEAVHADLRRVVASGTPG